MRKFIIFLTLGMFIMPINSWAYSARVDIESPWGSGYSQVHGDSKIRKLGGSLFGNYSSSTGSLTGITGTLRGLWGLSPTQKVVVNGGYFNNDGSGELKASVFSYKDGGYWRNVGKFSFFDNSNVDYINPYVYDNKLTSSYLKVWGGGDFNKSKLKWNGWKQKSGSDWLGADLYGKVVKLPEPGAIMLLLVSLIGFGLFLSMKKLFKPSENIVY